MNTIISLVYIKLFCVSFIEPQQNNLSNPEAYWEPCQTSKMECFAKIFKFFFFRKYCILDVWQSSEVLTEFWSSDTSVICYTLFVNIEGANRIDLVAMKIYSSNLLLQIYSKTIIIET